MLNEEQALAPSLIQAFQQIGFTNPHTAERLLKQITSPPHLQPIISKYLPALCLLLNQVSNPDQVMINLERLSSQMPHPESYHQHLAQNPRALEILVTVLAGSQFLSEILFRNPEYLNRLLEHKKLAEIQSPAEFHRKAASVIKKHSDYPSQLNALRKFQRWQLLRLGTSDLLGLVDLPAIISQLSHLADALTQTCLNLVTARLNTPAEGFAVLGMGKLGGQELNYSSDIDLLFICRHDERTYQKVGEQLIDALSRITAAGFLYRVDMRLRPWGRAGALVPSLSGYLNYLTQHAKLWEKQALVKARWIAGNQTLGQDFLKLAEPLIFATHREAVKSDVRTMKQRIESELLKNGRHWGEVKLGQGSIRDIEFTTQYLQLAYGDTHPQIRSANTLDALARLNASHFISEEEYHTLANGYTFLRPVEHWLQMMHYRQTHTLPSNDKALQALAHRLGFQGEEAGPAFIKQYNQHTTAIRQIYVNHLESDSPPPTPEEITQPPEQVVSAHLARLNPTYTTAFNEHEIKYHLTLIDRLNTRNAVEIKAIPLEEGRWQITIIGYDYRGALSLICGLLLIYGFDIIEGQVFTYRPLPNTHSRYEYTPTRPRQRPRRKKTADPNQHRLKIIDVFTVRPIEGSVVADFWSNYEQDLSNLLLRLEKEDLPQVQADLAKRVAQILRRYPHRLRKLYPIDIDIDNTSSTHRTVLHIDAPDTIGFLYELTNALAMSDIYISRLSVSSKGNRVHDFVHITDANGKKITDRQKQRELRAAIVLIKHFTHLLPRSPNPELALLQFRQFLRQSLARPNWPDELTSLSQPKVLDALARLLGVSDFLWKDFLRMQYANLFPIVRDVEDLAAPKSKTELSRTLSKELTAKTDRVQVLNAFKDREMFRIDMRHILDYIDDFEDFSAELSDLAEVVLETAYRLCLDELQAQYGQPLNTAGHPCSVSICAQGKCGGREMGYASDIELMFIYHSQGHTTGPERITTAEFFEKVVQQMVSTIQTRREGSFELDLRLRPYGKAGSLAVSMEAFQTYFAPDGPAWAYERQALVRLRPLAGDPDFGRTVLEKRDEMVYTGAPFDVTAMRGMRERQIRHLVAPGRINAKLSPGGLVDIEYLVQGLQITHGKNTPALRQTNTRQAMQALAQAGLLSADEHEALRAAHTFLRQLINALRMVHGHAKDLTVPQPDSEDFAFLGHRLHYNNDLPRLRADLKWHLRQVQEISQRLLG